MEVPSTPRGDVATPVSPLLDARPPKGLGHAFFPLRQPRRPRGRRHPRFRRDVRRGRTFCRPASPVRTAAAPDRPFSEATVPSGRLAQLFVLHALPSRLPTVRDASALPHDPRGPAAVRPLSRSLLPMPACAGCGGGSHRLADPVASAVSSLPHSRRRPTRLHAALLPPQSAAGRSPVLLLVRQ
jgi:hypothetical protein